MGIPDDALVVAVSGGFNETAGAEWLLMALRDRPNLHSVIQPLGLNATSRILLEHIRGRERVYLEKRRLDWQEAWASAAGADIGLAIYLNPAPQFQHMGTSSNRLCMFLSMGVPVIATRQASFQFLERYECGVLVESYAEFLAALDHIKEHLQKMKANAYLCARDYIDAKGKYRTLLDELQNVHS